jgi:hypothetical protein
MRQRGAAPPRTALIAQEEKALIHSHNIATVDNSEGASGWSR